MPPYDSRDTTPPRRYRSWGDYYQDTNNYKKGPAAAIDNASAATISLIRRKSLLGLPKMPMPSLPAGTTGM